MCSPPYVPGSCSSAGYCSSTFLPWRLPLTTPFQIVPSVCLSSCFFSLWHCLQFVIILCVCLALPFLSVSAIRMSVPRGQDVSVCCFIFGLPSGKGWLIVGVQARWVCVCVYPGVRWQSSSYSGMGRWKGWGREEVLLAFVPFPMSPPPTHFP